MAVAPNPKLNATQELINLIQRDVKNQWWFADDVKRLLKEGADPNVLLPNGNTVLQGYIATESKFNHHPEVIDAFLRHGAKPMALNKAGENATSFALSANNMKVASLLLTKGYGCPPAKLKDGFYQAIDLMLKNKPLKKADFTDINKKNAAGLTALHVAVALKNPVAVKNLLKCGADPLIKDNTGASPLKLAAEYNNADVIKALVDHNLGKKQDILKYSDFTLFKAKNDGITKGGFYKDSKNEGWLLKEGHNSSPIAVVKEYIAGAIYKLFLGENSSHTEIVIDNTAGEFLTGSKLLANFSTLSNYQPFGGGIPTVINGKKVVGFMNAISAIQFMGDTDAHSGNVGLINKGNHYAFAKIDHGFTFNYFGKAIDLDSFRQHLSNFYGSNDLKKLGYDAVYQSVTNISNMDFSVIEKAVCDNVTKVKTRMEVLDLNDLYKGYHDKSLGNLDQNLKKYQTDLIATLKQKHEDYKKMADNLALEKAIIDHDAIALSKLTAKGVCLDTKFKPFFNPIEVGDWWQKKTMETSGIELAKKHWPEVLKLNDLFPQQADLFPQHGENPVGLLPDAHHVFAPIANVLDHLAAPIAHEFFAI